MEAKKRFTVDFSVIRLVAALALSVLIAVAIILVVSDMPGEAIYKFLVSPLSNMRYISNVIELMIPLMFTGLAAALVFSVKAFNLTIEGGFFAGGLAAAAVACTLELPMGVHPTVALVAGMVVGALVVFIPAILKNAFDASEVVSSLMLNYVVFKVGDYFLKTFLRDPAVTHVTSFEYAATARLPILFGNVYLGIVFILLLLVAAWFLLFRTRWGFQIRVTGQNPLLAKASGMNVMKVTLLTQVLAGAVAGLGGASYILGATQRFTWGWRSGYGWDGLVVAIIARNNPAFVPVGALILAYLRVGSDIMSRTTDVQNEVVAIIQGVIIVLVASVGFLDGFRRKMVVKSALRTETEAAK